MPLVDYDEPAGIESRASSHEAVPEPENVRYLEPACPARAKRKPNPDLVVLYKLQTAQQLQAGVQAEPNEHGRDERASGGLKHSMNEGLGGGGEADDAGPEPKRRKRTDATRTRRAQSHQK